MQLEIQAGPSGRFRSKRGNRQEFGLSLAFPHLAVGLDVLVANIGDIVCNKKWLH